MECYQPSGSFKLRGIGALCEHAVAEGSKLIVCSSGGNAGMAAAYAGKMLKTNVTIVVPETTPLATRQLIEGYGAKVIVHGKVWNEANELAKQIVKDEHGFYVSPFDHPVIWKGHATLIDEMAEQMKKPDVIIASVGGGGLMCGVLEGLHRNNWSDVPVIAVETEGAAVFYNSCEAGRAIKADTVNTIASSLASLVITEELMHWKSQHKIIPHKVSDNDTVSACLNFLDDHKVLVEPACGAALTILYSERHRNLLKNYTNIAVVVCGGVNVTLEKLLAWNKPTA